MRSINSSEIAKIAGVSRSTVSRVINGYSNVPAETKEKVEKVIRKYGYVPNNSARNLAGKPGNVIGLFFVEFGIVEENIIHSSPFYSEFLTNAIDKLKKRGYQLLVSIVSTPSDLDTVVAMFRNKTISGCILMGDIVPNHILETLSKHNDPTLLVNQREYVPYTNIYLLNTENYQGAYAAVQTLVDHGHKRIAHITGAMEKTSIKERFEGYRDCLLQNELEYREKYIIYTHIHRAESGYNAVKELFGRIENGKMPTAIFTANDLLAFGAMRALKEMNFKIPEDISIVGYDNAELSQYMSPPLSTVGTCVEKLSEIAVNSLLAVIQGEKNIPNYIKMEEFAFINRKSIADIR